MERTTMFLHFSPGEPLPQVGESIIQESAMTHTRYRVTVRAILGTQMMSDGRIQLKVKADREVSEEQA